MFKLVKAPLACLSLALMSVSPIMLTAQEATIANTQLDFTKVAKEAIPAVVSIKVKGTSKQNDSSRNSWLLPDNEMNDLFNNDFFKQFFNMQKGKPEEVTGQASGFIVSADGYVLTNSHVVKDAAVITVVLNDRQEFIGTVVGQDPNTDVALIKIDGKDLPFLKLENSDQLEVGQWAIAIGNPMGLQASLTVGVISAKGRNDLDIARIEDFIQTDAAINRGNSGGPLLTLSGEVVGMNTAIVTNMGSGYMGIGFAIPSNILRHVMDELLTNGKVSRGFVGVVLQQMDQNLAKAFNLSKAEGALIAEVSKDSPAEKAGIKQGDIVLKYNTIPVLSIAALRNAIALMKPGQRITLTILREKEKLEVPIEIGNFPTEHEKTALAEPKENKFGFSVQELNPETAKAFGYREDEKGVVIDKIHAGTPAAWTGLKKGSLILAVNQTKVTSVEEFNRLMEATENGRPLLLLVKQGESVRFVSLLVNQ